MPVLDASVYVPSRMLRHRHLATYLPYFLKKAPTLPYVRNRISTPDQDFIDLDTIINKSNRLAILCHGLEGDSSSKYVRSIGAQLSELDYDVVAMNYRGCSGEMNRSIQMYHSGKTDDLDTVINAYIDSYDEIILIGFSLGGNLVLKYVGERGNQIHSNIKASVAVSVPCDLASCSSAFTRPENYLYEQRFMVSLKKKLRIKKKQFPDLIDTSRLGKVKNIYTFDDLYTAPIHGFADADDYYKQCSSKQFLQDIKIPTLIVSSIDDPFLTQESIPYTEAKNSDYLYLLATKYGGHVGFAWNLKDNTYSEDMTLQFLEKHL